MRRPDKLGTENISDTASQMLRISHVICPNRTWLVPVRRGESLHLDAWFNAVRQPNTSSLLFLLAVFTSAHHSAIWSSFSGLLIPVIGDIVPMLDFSGKGLHLHISLTSR